jgi:hypothetical protein
MTASSGSKRRRVACVSGAVVAALFLIVASAQASFGLREPLGFTQAASSDPADPTFPADPADLFTQAGGHPYEVTASFALNLQSGSSVPDGDLQDISLTFPRGLIGNPQNAAQCPLARLTSATRPCPIDSQVGVAAPFINDVLNKGFGPVPIYNLAPDAGRSVEFGFVVAGSMPVVFYAGLGAAPARLLHFDHLATPPVGVTGLSITLWGVPSEPSHDAVRAFPRPLPLSGACQAAEVACEFGAASSADPTPFLTNSTDCSGGPLVAALSISAYQEPEPKTYTAEGLAPSGCDQLIFAPTLSVASDDTQAETPAGYIVELTVPQSDDVEQLAPPQLKDATIELPPGVSLSPSAGNGLQACSDQRFGLETIEPPACPPSSRLGNAQIHMPLVAAPLVGGVYLGTPQCDPCSNADASSGRMVRLFIEAHGAGLEFKLPGVVDIDPTTGQLTVTFSNSPQLPFDDIQIELRSGPRALLANPDTCGVVTATSILTPWSAPVTPAATPSSSFDIDSGPNGGPCVGDPAHRPLAPGFSAGTIVPIAGAHSPLMLDLSREDGQQQLSRFEVTTPPGLLATLRGVSICSDGELAVAASNSGRAEQNGSACPVASQIGTVRVALGAGSSPFHVSGKVYLGAAYKGAPISIAAVLPAVVGPLDLGTVVVRSAAHVDPSDSHIHMVSDRLPQVLRGIPLNVRDIHVNLDRANFILNPTSCDQFSIVADVFGDSGGSARVSNPYQAGACAAIPFGPKFMASVRGGTKRAQNPTFRNTVIEGFPGEANPEMVSFALPHSEFLDQSHIKTICTRVQFSQDSCPARSIYGHAKVLSPLVDYALEGPVYLRSSDHYLPDVVFALRGPAWQPIEINLVGRVDSKAGGIRTTFEGFPDAEISKFILAMQGGKRGLLVNSTDLCRRPHRFTVKVTAHNGKKADQTRVLGNSCRKSKAKGNGHKHHQPRSHGH